VHANRGSFIRSNSSKFTHDKLWLDLLAKVLSSLPHDDPMNPQRRNFTYDQVCPDGERAGMELASRGARRAKDKPSVATVGSTAESGEGIGLRGNSGTTFIQKFSFSTLWFSPFVATISVGYQREAYSAVYDKVDVATIGMVASVLMIWTILNDILIGYLQDKESLACLFPKATWGRRAPWVSGLQV
jgi:hypothetical protein